MRLYTRRNNRRKSYVIQRQQWRDASYRQAPSAPLSRRRASQQRLPWRPAGRLLAASFSSSRPRFRRRAYVQINRQWQHGIYWPEGWRWWRPSLIRR